MEGSRGDTGVFVLGLTGGLGSGKSTVATLLAERGCEVVDADVLAAVQLKPGTSAYREVLQEFGRSVLEDDGTVDRAGLAQRVFSDPDALQRLESIIHPRVIENIRGRIARAVYRDCDLIVLDVPLLYEAGLEWLCDEVWVVYCRPTQQIERTENRSHLSRGAILRRMKAQMSIEEKVQRADRVIDNTGTRADLTRRVDAAWKALKEARGFCCT